MTLLDADPAHQGSQANMSLEYVDEDLHGQQPHSISRLVSSYMEPEDCHDAVRQSFRIVELLLLSDHRGHAHSLATALYKHMNTILPGEASRPSSRALEYFWFTQPSNVYPAPTNFPKQAELSDGSPEALKEQERYERMQWNEYRECTRTGWMLEHCNLPEPEDPHIWRETDEAPMIGMCARLLAKDKTPGQYPPIEQLQEALSAAEKLYAQPEVPHTEWKPEYAGNQTVRRHSYLLYRRLVVELAIRVGRLDKAAELLSQGLVLDGFNTVDGAGLDRFLMLPKIYDVLPLLAAKGKDGNPFYMEESDAAAIVQEITQTLERRAEHGRQWSLAPEKVGWRELLDRLAKAAWALNSAEYKHRGIMSADEILNEPESEEDIEAAEDRVGKLPDDLKEMYRIAGGFKGGYHFLNGGIGGCDGILFDESGNRSEDLFYENGLNWPDDLAEDFDTEVVVELSPGVESDDILHFLVTPDMYRKLAQSHESYKDGEYRYWYTSHWMCDNSWYKSVREWVALTVETLERRVEDGELEPELDYSYEADYGSD